MKQPWLKFYSADWRSDVTLGTCSLAARGLWMEMLCIMSEAEPRGSLAKGGKAFTIGQLSALARAPAKDVEKLIEELEREAVFSRDEDGTIYSRRMRRDIEKAIKDKANGKGGGNPNLKPKDKSRVNPLDKPDDKAQKPETRDHMPETELRSVGERISANDLYEKLISAAGGRVDQSSISIQVVGPIEDLLAAGCDLDRHVLETVRRIAPSLGKPLRTWNAPFLRDEILAAKAADAGRVIPKALEPRINLAPGIDWPLATVELHVAQWAKDRSWPVPAGPPPFAEGCKVPAHLLSRLKREDAA